MATTIERSLDSASDGRAARRRLALGALALLIGTAGTVGAALVFEHRFGYIPCALCLKERVPYYVAAAVSAGALATALAGARPRVPRALVALVGLLMLWSLALGTYHAGVEWGWWLGPTDCAVAVAVDLSGDLLATIDAVHPPACNVAAGRFWGLSFAGWNVVASAFFAVLAFALLRPGWTRR